jgi:hypothetical protein
MTDDAFEHPILNSPYVVPGQRREAGSEQQPVNCAVEGRPDPS